MPRNPSKIYKYHVANLKELELAISHTSRLARSSIASRDPNQSLRSLLRLYAFLIGAWAETRLIKLLHEEYGFNEPERNLIMSKSTQLEQWQETVDLGFRKHHQVPKAPLNEYNIGITHAARRTALHDVLDKDLKITIEIRNRLAHGQWRYPFNNEGTEVEQLKYRQLNQENLQSLQFKFSLIRHLADTVHDLVVSQATFERDFESHFKKLLQVKTNLKTKDYMKYKLCLIKSREKARFARKSNKGIERTH